MQGIPRRSDFVTAPLCESTLFNADQTAHAARGNECIAGIFGVAASRLWKWNLPLHVAMLRGDLIEIRSRKQSKLVESAAVRQKRLGAAAFRTWDIPRMEIFWLTPAGVGYYFVILIGYPSSFLGDCIERVFADADLSSKLLVGAPRRA